MVLYQSRPGITLCFIGYETNDCFSVDNINTHLCCNDLNEKHLQTNFHRGLQIKLVNCTDIKLKANAQIRRPIQ